MPGRAYCVGAEISTTMPSHASLSGPTRPTPLDDPPQQLGGTAARLHDTGCRRMPGANHGGVPDDRVYTAARMCQSVRRVIDPVPGSVGQEVRDFSASRRRCETCTNSL
jgi:hypothetical protein